MHPMSDRRKLVLVTAAALLLAVLAMAENLGLGTYLAGISEQKQRRDHYERVLMKKGLSLHEGSYWKGKEQVEAEVKAENGASDRAQPRP